jgi:hypothetical protein
MVGRGMFIKSEPRGKRESGWQCRLSLEALVPSFVNGQRVGTEAKETLEGIWKCKETQTLSLMMVNNSKLTYMEVDWCGGEQVTGPPRSGRITLVHDSNTLQDSTTFKPHPSWS